MIRHGMAGQQRGSERAFGYKVVDEGAGLDDILVDDEELVIRGNEEGHCHYE